MKLPLFLLLVAIALHTGPAGLAVLTLFLALALIVARLPLGRLAREFRPFAALLLLMFLARSLASDRGGQDFAAGGTLVWKLSLLLLLGLLLTATTAISRLQAAVAWYLRPLPFVPEGRIATMVGLTITLIPLVFDSYREISDAQAARSGQSVRNPLRRIRVLVIPLILKTFGRADRLAAAMESRCYSDDRSFAPLVSRGSDWLAALLVVVVAAAALLAGRLA